jgi:hypothetical protein
LDLTKSQFGCNQNNRQSLFDNRKSFKKSIRKISFKTEAVGSVWLNARRPSIKAELNLLKIKQNRIFNFNNKIYNHYKATEIDELNGSSLKDIEKNENNVNLRNQSKMKKFFHNAFHNLSRKFNSEKTRT